MINSHLLYQLSYSGSSFGRAKLALPPPIGNAGAKSAKSINVLRNGVEMPGAQEGRWSNWPLSTPCHNLQGGVSHATAATPALIIRLHRL